MLMRGGTSKGAYFLSEDLPSESSERDDLLLRIMGSPDSKQIDGIGGAHPLTSKVAIVSRSASGEDDVDFLFAQVSVDKALVDTSPNCGNILAGVGAFAIERGLVKPQAGETRVRVKTLNTGTRAELVMRTADGSVIYDGDEEIVGVPGTAAGIPVNFLDTAGSVCGKLFPTGRRMDRVQGFDVTCVDNGMPVIILRAADFGFSGYETCAQVEARTEALKRVEAVRIESGEHMGIADVAHAVVPKVFLVAPALQDGCISTRCLIPHKCHESIGVFAAVSVATACVLTGTVAYEMAAKTTGPVRVMHIEHPGGQLAVRLELGGSEQEPTVERGGLIRTARPLFDGTVFPGPLRRLQEENT